MEIFNDINNLKILFVILLFGGIGIGILGLELDCNPICFLALIICCIICPFLLIRVGDIRHQQYEQKIIDTEKDLLHIFQGKKMKDIAVLPPNSNFEVQVLSPNNIHILYYFDEKHKDPIIYYVFEDEKDLHITHKLSNLEF